MKVIFMGTPEFAVGTLEAIIEAGHEVLCVVTQPDRNRGKGKGVSFSPVKEVAVGHGISVLQPEKVKDNTEFYEAISGMNADVSVVVAYGQILPQDILDASRYGALNVHASLLPSYRGAAPIEWSIIDGCDRTGVTIMQMDAGLDTGDILAQTIVPIRPDDTAAALETRLSAAGAGLLVSTLDELASGNINPQKQGETDTRYSSMLSKQMGEIDWTNEAAYIERLIRGLTPWPGTYTFLKGKMLKIWWGEVLDELPELSGAEPGSYYCGKTCMFVMTGKGVLKVTEVQAEGKKRMPAADFIRGLAEKTGTFCL